MNIYYGPAGVLRRKQAQAGYEINGNWVDCGLQKLGFFRIVQSAALCLSSARSLWDGMASRGISAVGR